MKTQILKSFSSFSCDAELAVVSFKDSRQEVFQVSVRFLVPPKDWSSNYQVLTFGESKHDAENCFRDFVKDFI